MAENEQKKEIYRWKGGGSSGGTFAFALRITTLLLWLGLIGLAQGEGNVGCQFVQTLCLDENEFCYDDLVFGKCLPISGVELEDIEKRPLTEEQSRILGTMLEEMQGAGLGWNHPFVQCRIQGSLFSLRRDTPLPPNLCANLAPDPEILGPQSPLAFVRFTPPNENFADEVYYPPPKKELIARDPRLIGHPPRIDSGPHLTPISDNFEIISPFNQPNLAMNIQRHPQASNINSELRDGFINEELSNRVKDIKNRIEFRKMMGQYEKGQLRPAVYPNGNVYSEGDELYDDMGIYKRKEMKVAPEAGTFFREIAQNEHFPLNYDHERIPFKINPFNKLLSNDRLKKLDNNVLKDDDMFASNIYPVKYPKKTEGVYTEGGLLFVPERARNDGNVYENRKEEARILLANMLGFTRHERLDVKKPGPLVGPPPSASTIENNNSLNKDKKISGSKEILPEHIKNDGPPKKKNQVKEHLDDDHAPHTVDTEYAHVFLKNPLDNWSVGSRIVNELAEILHMKGYFTHLRVDRHEVSFRVDPSNLEGKNASDVARAINDPRVQGNLNRRLGITVVLAGVGNKVKSNELGVSASRIELAEEGPDVTHIMAYMFAGAGAAAVIVIVVILVLIRRNDKKRDKLGGLQSGVSASESCSKDYQELCRSRMSGKGNNPEQPASGRITSLTKENDRPPSSRSSTSSWSEEPALTNMDISTGHMVLSYMEDHLRNKGRLQREWEALCRYEAEPNAREAALQPQCSALNRSTAPLPYDHSRVVLNHLANAEGLDYVNASTITDHDPRAPAYVAAQGPLPTTLAHFWQMIWEQGAVVIVSLCRLQENGEIACARYWPEEGAEVYHIYEVHLVSEHIWCEDYLVRSFYLKNLRTSETRTVTQFHFLSWPQGGVPASAKALLDFRRKVNKSYRGRSCPIVVHGSTGAGRTGAYILLDLVLGRMNKGAREIDIAATLEHLRDQRAGLVATRQQFEFVLMAVAEEVHAILKALPANQSDKRDLDKEPSVKEEENVEKEKTDKDISPKKDKEKAKKKDKKSEE